MSQAGIANANAIPPPPGSITDLQGQDGITVPPNGSGIIFVQGTVVAAGTTPFTTTGDAGTSTETWSIQYSQAIASSNALNVGLSAFNSAQFTVDANGFVSLSGTGVGETITGQSGGALSPVAGNWNIYGAAVAAGTTPVASSGSGNTLTLNVQRSQAIASTNASNVGLAAFNSGQFSVDTNGFVSLLGTAAISGVTVDVHTAPGTSPVVPNSSGDITVTGGQVAAGTTTNVIQTNSLAANTYTIQIQRSQAVASSTIGDNGVCHFNSAQFTVDANGFVSSLGAGFVWIDQATSTTLANNTGYFVTAATTQTLPSSPVQGTVVKIAVDTSGTVIVAANTGQTIRVGNLTSSSGGSMTNSLQGDTLELVYRASDTTWFSIATTGVWTAA